MWARARAARAHRVNLLRLLLAEYSELLGRELPLPLLLHRALRPRIVPTESNQAERRGRLSPHIREAIEKRQRISTPTELPTVTARSGRNVRNAASPLGSLERHPPPLYEYE